MEPYLQISPGSLPGSPEEQWGAVAGVLCLGMRSLLKEGTASISVHPTRKFFFCLRATAEPMGFSEPLRVLSVEDNPETRLLLKHLLKESYEVVLVASAEEALSHVGSEPFDLLLVDIHLGEGKSGTELLHLLREREPAREVPAIAVTAYSMPGDRADLLEEGFDGYVSKPFTKAELTETIGQVLPARTG